MCLNRKLLNRRDPLGARLIMGTLEFMHQDIVGFFTKHITKSIKTHATFRTILVTINIKCYMKIITSQLNTAKNGPKGIDWL